jgi:hypothetical protein
MVSIDKVSFNRHLPNCCCYKCGVQRERFLCGKSHQGRVVEVIYNESDLSLIKYLVPKKTINYKIKTQV